MGNQLSGVRGCNCMQSRKKSSPTMRDLRSPNKDLLLPTPKKVAWDSPPRHSAFPGSMSSGDDDELLPSYREASEGTPSRGADVGTRHLANGGELDLD